LWWVKDAQNLQTAGGLRAAPDFIDQYITTRVPSEDSGDDVLRELVLRVQKHNHTCCKTGTRCCRFDYPQNA